MKSLKGKIGVGVVLALLALVFAPQLASATVTLQAALAAITFDPDFNGHKLTNVADPTSAQHVATKSYADSTMALGESRVRTALAALTAAPSFNSQRITSVADPSGAQDVATKTSSEAVVTSARVQTATAALGSALNLNAQNLVNVTQIGLNTTSPTHPITLDQTASATGIALNNLSTISTNFERLVLYFSGSIAQIATTAGGTGAVRQLRLSSSTASLTLNAGTFTFAGGRPIFDATNTAGGTTGNQTINKASGTVNIAAAGTSAVVTNSTVLATSLVFCTIRTNDSTAYLKSCVPAAGSFTVNLGAAATAETSVGFVVIN